MRFAIRQTEITVQARAARVEKDYAESENEGAPLDCLRVWLA